ncbi:uncharacterized protein LOC122668612 [Telopea speciosissima]|uniref:uncharacterized protein LOC122668612 n=1 Tax=Telopea speciosissima TaxID=54955 RepID=UPI001CC6AA59|nr:uncharacterized protein LOC122668612 [Telopea speciosissima]
MSSRVHKKTTANLLAIKQHSDEMIRDFLVRFNNEALEIRNLDPIVKFHALRNGIKYVELKKSLIIDEPADMYDLFSHCKIHINLAEVLAAEQEKETKAKKKNPEKKDSHPGGNSHKDGKDQNDGTRKRDDRAWLSRSDSKPELTYTALTHNRTYILNEIKDQVTLRWPGKMIKPTHDHNKNTYCRFHQDHGHDMEEYRRLKEEIEALIQRGHLSRFIKKDGGDQRQENQP